MFFMQIYFVTTKSAADLSFTRFAKKSVNFNYSFTIYQEALYFPCKHLRFANKVVSSVYTLPADYAHLW